MTRRDFVAAAVASTGTVLGGASSLLSFSIAPAARRLSPAARPDLLRPEVQAASPQFYELRRYRLRRGPHQQAVADYWRDAAIPALRRAGAGPVGVFTVSIGPESPSLYVLIVYPTLDVFAAADARLGADAEYQKAGATYLNASATDPAFVRLESSLFRAFRTMPALALPFGGGEAGRRTRLFELRTYESHSEKASRSKIEMFNTGEIAIFRRAGLQPVFFGEAIVGPNMPNLTYLLVYEDMAARDRQWAAFSADPEWRTLSTTPGLTDPEIVMSISNVYLRPTMFSEI